MWVSTSRPVTFRKYREQIPLPLVFADGTPCHPLKMGLELSPSAWKELERAKRVYCGGMGCAKAHRIVRESDGRTWLTFVT